VDGRRTFSLREANALVDALQREFTRARSLRDQLAELQEALAKEGRPLEGPMPKVDPDAPPAVLKLQQRAQRVIGELRDLLRELTELGVEVKQADGLVDFRTKLHGRIVYLCWKYGEERITHWHEMDAGFAGRQPVTTESDFIGDLLH
jgi:hypothetical protein